MNFIFSASFDTKYASELAEFGNFLQSRVAKRICYRFDIHSLFLTHDGYVYSRGLNHAGQLGLGDKVNRYRKDGHIMPVRVPGLEGIINIFSGCHESFCIDKDHRVYAWGSNSSGLLGLGHNEDVTSPCLVEALADHRIVTVQTNACVAYFLDDEGSVYSCGRYNSSASTGLGEWTCHYPDKNPVNSPVKIAGLPPVMQVVPLGDHVFFLSRDGLVYGCGNNWNGQLGQGDQEARFTPVKLDLPPVRQIDGSWDCSFFLTIDGRVFACGKNERNQISLGLTVSGDHPENYYGLVELTKLNEPIVKMQACGFCSIFLTQSQAAFVHYLVANHGNDHNDELAGMRGISIPIPGEVMDTCRYGRSLYPSRLYQFNAGSSIAALCHRKLGVPLSLKLQSAMTFFEHKDTLTNKMPNLPDDISAYIDDVKQHRRDESCHF